MAVSSKDIAILWRRYSDEGVKKGISVAQFFESNGVPYHTFEKWYKKYFSQPGVVDCVVSGNPDSVSQTPTTEKAADGRSEKKKELCVSYVNIGFSNGMRIEHHKLSYDDLVCFINKLQLLCSA